MLLKLVSELMSDSDSLVEQNTFYVSALDYTGVRDDSSTFRTPLAEAGLVDAHPIKSSRRSASKYDVTSTRNPSRFLAVPKLKMRCRRQSDLSASPSVKAAVNTSEDVISDEAEDVIDGKTPLLRGAAEGRRLSPNIFQFPEPLRSPRFHHSLVQAEDSLDLASEHSPSVQQLNRAFFISSADKRSRHDDIELVGEDPPYPELNSSSFRRHSFLVRFVLLLGKVAFLRPICWTFFMKILDFSRGDK